MLGINIKLGLQQMLIQNDVNILPINITLKWVENACLNNACFVKLFINILLLSTSESEFRSWFMDRGNIAQLCVTASYPPIIKKIYKFDIHLIYTYKGKQNYHTLKVLNISSEFHGNFVKILMVFSIKFSNVILMKFQWTSPEFQRHNFTGDVFGFYITFNTVSTILEAPAWASGGLSWLQIRVPSSIPTAGKVVSISLQRALIPSLYLNMTEIVLVQKLFFPFTQKAHRNYRRRSWPTLVLTT